jgi:DNA-binding MarR family transcriptional regulator
MSGRSQRAPETAAELMKAMTRLRARLRAESAPSEMRWNWSQLTTLGRLAKEGPATTSDLAQAEHVRRQSMAETIAALRADGLVEAQPDPTDGRKTLIRATSRGRSLSATIPAAREAWLGSAVNELLDVAEQQTLRKAAAIMNRIADSDLRSPQRS